MSPPYAINITTSAQGDEAGGLVVEVIRAPESEEPHPGAFPPSPVLVADSLPLVSELSGDWVEDFNIIYRERVTTGKHVCTHVGTPFGFTTPNTWVVPSPHLPLSVLVSSSTTQKQTYRYQHHLS
jgi:hypothetical protein